MQEPKLDLSRAAVLLTGSSRGLGRHLFQGFIAAGYDLLLPVRKEQDGNSLQQEFARRAISREQKCITIIGDIKEFSTIESLLAAAAKNYLNIKAIINNAAIHGLIGPVDQTSIDAWRDVLEVNLIAPLQIIKSFTPLLQETGGGSIVNVSGGGATGPRPNFSAYACSKTALVRLTETLSYELSPYNIRINAIAPGSMPTDLLKEVVQIGSNISGDREFTAAQKALAGSDNIFEKVKDLVLFLAGDRSAKINGKLISAQWDNWENWSNYSDELENSDLYTIRRVTARDRGKNWGDH